ncbi:hypothetical protein INT08_10715 [Prosthecochloris sp. N3]|uniref:DUF4402 domain-containing protein n=1 Tax=Prosthecochloris ethylica TaxID=2743976 RepID=A0ABR9XUF1_9CHLB|nr:hypothetical protein [Prosthecochloris ethylica]MBF0587131.1 hypothetical protein [Prosthecochloris ethylica]MBF0637641.1 hypothetical protein [Prosthecochloris ethylica]NUK48073.1 hypothetical protein [Prosthecochloris ethylica]
MNATLKNTIASALFATALFMTAGTAHATVKGAGQSVSADTKVSVTVPDFIILHYHDNLNLNFGTANAVTVNEGSNQFDVSWTGTATGGDESQLQNKDDAMESFFQGDSKVTVALDGMWAVRGLSESGKARITISGEQDRMEQDGSVISITDKNVYQGDKNNKGKNIDVALNGFGLSNATIGGVELGLDFSKTTKSGTHTGATYTITAETI